MYMLVGMEIYAHKIKVIEVGIWNLENASNFPETNFNSPLEAFIAVFIVIANDGWTKVFFDHYRAGNPVIASIFFLSLIMLG